MGPELPAVREVTKTQGRTQERGSAKFVDRLCLVKKEDDREPGEGAAGKGEGKRVAESTPETTSKSKGDRGKMKCSLSPSADGYEEEDGKETGVIL